MHTPVIDACLAALGMPPGGLPSILVPTSFDRFELLQTPGLWGHDPADNSYWLPTDGGPAPLPTASRRLLDAIEDVVAHTESILDIAALESFATGGFAAAIRRGLATTVRHGRRPIVRILYGRHGFVREGFAYQHEADFDAFVAWLAADLPPDCGIDIHACLMKSSSTMPTISWNHAKIVAADGLRAIVGGHNFWHDDYLSFAPVHDVSVLVEGRAAGEAHAFLDTLWNWVRQQEATDRDDLFVHAIRWQAGLTEVAAPPLPVSRATLSPGGIPALAVGRLGIGVLSDPRVANAGAAVAAVAFRQARQSIRISQMDFGLFWEGTNHWSADVIAALVDVLTDPERRVEVSLVLSECGAKTAAGGPYSFGTTIPDVIAEIRRGIAERPLTGRMRVAPLRIAPQGDRWMHGEQSLAFSNHAKVWIVDDRVFHVGSDNLYPHSLQEFGYVVESAAAARGLLDAYWTPLWAHSARASIELTSPNQAEGCRIPP